VAKAVQSVRELLVYHVLLPHLLSHVVGLIVQKDLKEMILALATFQICNSSTVNFGKATVLMDMIQGLRGFEGIWPNW
jgi:hypothetical protein